MSYPSETLLSDVLSRYAQAQAAVDIGGTTVSRLAVLGRLAEEDHPVVRRKLFLALQPVWHTICDDYAAVLAAHPGPWPVDANALALGMDPSSVEDSLLAVLSAWRSSYAVTEVEPWDWWWQSGATARALRSATPLARLA